jgi:hypothetical protein
MDFLHFQSASLYPNSGISHLCEDLNNVVGHGIWHDTYLVQNTDILWLVNEIIEAMNSRNVLCGCLACTLVIELVF